MEDFDKSKELPDSWYWTDKNLTNQLEKEINENHILYGKKLRTLACRQDNDDALFLIDNKRLAIVHLTGSDKKQTDNKWPRTKLFDTWDDFINTETEGFE